MPNGIERQPTPAMGAVVAAFLIVVALLVRRKKHARSKARAESLTRAAQVKDAGGHALGKAASAARDLMSEAADLVGDGNLSETLDRIQSALDDARSAAAVAVRKAPVRRH